jgi:Tol biopolymer transport system component
MKTLLLTLTVSVSALAQQASSSERRFDVPSPATTDVISLAISPDGEKMAFVATVDRRNQLWVCRIQEQAVNTSPAASSSGAAAGDKSLPPCGQDRRRLDGAASLGVSFPFWAPDSRSVAFATNSTIRIVNIETGNGRTLLNYGGGGHFQGGTWSKEGGGEGTILFATTGPNPIRSVSVSGANPTNVTVVRRPQEFQHVFPSFLPDGRSFLYYTIGDRQARGIYAARIGSGTPKRLMDADTAAVYSTTGRLFFAREGKLLSQRFDPITLTLAGEPAVVAERIPHLSNAAALSASRTGRVAYRSGTASRTEVNGTTIKIDVADSVEKQFIWFDRTGREIAKVGNPVADMEPFAPSLSPDGRAAFVRTAEGNTDIWLLDAKTETFRRFTSDEARDIYPIWSPNGDRIAFSSGRTNYEPFVKSASPSLAAAVQTPMLPRTPQQVILPLDWSSDGRYIVVAAGATNILVAMTNGTLANMANQAEGHVYLPQISPDGKWVAFQSDRTGNTEIHLAPFVPGSLLEPLKDPVSRNGGGWPRWSRDGKELFYAAPDGYLMAVPFDAGKGRATGPPQRLFIPPMLGYTNQNTPGQQYMVSDDGRFLVVAVSEVQSPIHIIEN